MNAPEQQKNNAGYCTRDAAESVALHDAGNMDDIALVQLKLTEAADREEEDIALIYLRRMFRLAVFSSDYVDIARILKKYPGLQEHFSIAGCICRAEEAARVPGDRLEIENFIRDLPP